MDGENITQSLDNFDNSNFPFLIQTFSIKFELSTKIQYNMNNIVGENCSTCKKKDDWKCTLTGTVLRSCHNAIDTITEIKINQFLGT